jgi:predicted DNA-binding protein
MKKTRKTVDRHSKNTRQLNAFVPVEVFNKLEQLADADFRRRSAYVRTVLIRHVQEIEAKERAAAASVAASTQQPPITKSA